MSRSRKNGASYDKKILQMKWIKLRNFLIAEALKGNPTAFKLLKDMPANTAEVLA